MLKVVLHQKNTEVKTTFLDSGNVYYELRSLLCNINVTSLKKNRTHCLYKMVEKTNVYALHSILSLHSSAIHVDDPPSVPTLTTSYAHGISSNSLLYRTVDQCLQASVVRHPDREAMVFVQDGIRKTFAEFYQDVSGVWFFREACTVDWSET